MCCAARPARSPRSPTTPVLWGARPYGVARSRLRSLAGSHSTYNSPLRLGFQQRHQSVRRPELTLAKVRRYNCLNSFELLARVGANIDLRGGEVAVSQP